MYLYYYENYFNDYFKGFKMKDDYKLFEGFIAASLHDIGKLALKNNQWEHHEYLVEISKRNDINIDFLDLLGQNIVDLISIHHEKNSEQDPGLFDFSDLSSVEYALILSDKIQSSMIPMVSGEDLECLKSSQKYFNPYYGNVTKWDDINSVSVLKEFLSELNKLGKFETNQQKWANNIFSFQNKILRYPFLTFMPHLSLKLHHQLSSVLFLFLREEILEYSDLKMMKKFKFYVFEVSPNLDIFFRLRDISGFHNIMERFSEILIDKLFGKYRGELRGVPNKKSNPFLFYNRDSLVFLHTSFQVVLETLQETLDKLNIFYSVSVKVKGYDFGINIQNFNNSIYEGIYVDSCQNDRHKFTIFSRTLFDYDSYANNICMICNMPIKSDKEKKDDKGNVLCDLCYNLRKESTGYNLDIFGGPGERLSYIFLIMPDDLIGHSRETAESSLINQFLAESKLKAYSVSATKNGLLEYLQALNEFSLFQQDINVKDGSAINFFNSPKLTCYLFRENETQPWEFLRYLNSKRVYLNLNLSLFLINCNTKTPFWSLMESIQEYNSFKGDVFYDISGGFITMFNPAEVNKIRDLAEFAAKNDITQTQLFNISEVALSYSKEELLLEIEIRMNNRKSFLSELQKGINMLEFDGSNKEYENRLKRAVFLKYIGKLVQNRNPQKRW